MKIDRIVKVFRSDSEQILAIDTGEVFENEIIKLVSVSHSNVISVYGAGYLKPLDGARCHSTQWSSFLGLVISMYG